MALQYTKPEPISLKDHPEFSELWLRQRIEEDPSILGLGDLEVRDVERIHPKAGRLDMLLREPETGKRYEVEIMLGTVDESHIIRAIEYWDIERKRYPQYEHSAVVIAERITSRFLNVISLFNGSIPLVAIQLNALRINDLIALSFTTVLDEISLGTDEEDEVGAVPTDRPYWEKRGGKGSMKLVDECFALLGEVAPNLALNYTKFYIGLIEAGRPNNFVVLRARKQFTTVDVKVDDVSEWNERLGAAGFDVMAPNIRHSQVRIRITPKDLQAQRELLSELFRTAHNRQAD